MIFIIIHTCVKATSEFHILVACNVHDIYQKVLCYFILFYYFYFIFFWRHILSFHKVFYPELTSDKKTHSSRDQQ